MKNTRTCRSEHNKWWLLMQPVGTEYVIFASYLLHFTQVNINKTWATADKLRWSYPMMPSKDLSNWARCHVTCAISSCKCDHLEGCGGSWVYHGWMLYSLLETDLLLNATKHLNPLIFFTFSPECTKHSNCVGALEKCLVVYKFSCKFLKSQ